MEKDSDSMATVQMKPEYAASEVYSTASEPPPAYRRKSSAVQIAKIIAVTVIASSFIIGCFILASTYLHTRASCDQMQTLDAVLEKELMLETLQQEIPRAEALLQGKDNSADIDLQNIENKETDKQPDKKETNTEDLATTLPENDTANDSDGDSSFSDNDETEELNRVHIKLPLELDLSDLAHAILENNQKSRMNCVVERRRAEELVDAPAKTMALPFGLNLTTDPKQKRVTGERISIFCESGSEVKNDEAEQIRPIIIPLNRFPIPFGAIPQQFPLTHMPQQQMPPPPPPPPQHQQQQQQQQQFSRPQFIIRQWSASPFEQQEHQQQEMRQMTPLRSLFNPMPPQMQMHQMPPPSPQQMHEISFQPQQMHQMPPQSQQIHQMPPQMAQQMPQMPPQMPQQMHQMPPQMPQQMHQMPPRPQQMHQMPPQPQQMQRITAEQLQRMRPQQMHQMPPIPDQIMQAPRPEQPEIRIQLQRIPLPIRGEMNEPVEIREIFNPLQKFLGGSAGGSAAGVNNNMSPQIQVQRIPLAVALERAGITQDDLKNIQRMTEERIQQELRQLAMESDNSSSNSDSENSSEEVLRSIVQQQQQQQQQQNESQQKQQQMKQQSNNNDNSDDDNDDDDDDDDDELPLEEQILQIGRAAFGRSLVNPIRIPINMMQQELPQQENHDSERPHFVQPRSVRNDDEVLLKESDGK